MQKFILFLLSCFIVVFVFLGTAILHFYNTKSVTIKKYPQKMKITSPAFENQQKIPTKYTCSGESINPPLEFSDIPANAKTLALVVDDPDAPNGDFVHWIVYNIDPTTKSVAENSKPSVREGYNSIGKPGYIAPCPPSGTHRYFFKLYALAIMLDGHTLDKTALEGEMKGHILDQAELIGLYS